MTCNEHSIVCEVAAVRLAYSCVGNLSQSNQPPRSTQPGHPSMGRCNEYRPKGGDALRLGLKADMVSFAGNTV